MKWVPDRSGRFPQRPHYEPDELDFECEGVITRFLEERHGRVEFPIVTDDLTVLIERVVADLDLYADLSGEEGEVEGVTEFRPGQKPRVRISAALARPYLENRLRTTLTHEFGHVHFHGFLFEFQPSGQLLFPIPNDSRINKCKREAIVGARQSDWMEWQAGFACGALLMPRSALRREAQTFSAGQKLPRGGTGADTPEGIAMIDRIATAFMVSRDAARVRLLQRGYLMEGGGAGQRGLFSPA
jgi:hypothetical protein